MIFKNIYYIEILLNDGNFIQATINESFLDKIKTTGTKRLKGSIYFQDNQYLFIQIRKSKTNDNWYSLYDILVNKHYCGKMINDCVINFVINNNAVFDMYKNNILYTKPNVLYTHLDSKYNKYFNITNSIQYCGSKDGLVKLSNYTCNDNIRCLAFITDNNTENIPTWTFKNEKDLLFFHIEH